MKPILMRLLLAISLVCLTGCRGQEENEPEAVEQAVDSSLPGPKRAAAAAKRVAPLLKPKLAKLKLKLGDQVYLRAFKEERELELWMKPAAGEKHVLLETYPIVGSSGTLGPKLAEGDRQVPEGFYYFGRSLMNPNSRYHLAFNIGYPNPYDRHHGRTGSYIMVHGSRFSIGCLAMTDPKIEEIYTLCDAALNGGQPFIRIHLFPFRMTATRMQRSADSEHIDFWKNLREGYDHFESHHTPPEIEVVSGRYQVQPLKAAN